MRILYVCSDFGIPVYGHKGASIHLRAISRALSDLGHAVCILSPATERVANHDFDLPVRTLAPPQEDVDSVSRLRTVDKMIGSIASRQKARVGYEVRNLLYNRTVAEAAAHVRDLSIDVIYERYSLFAFGGLELARALDVPHLLEVNAPLVLERQRTRGLHLTDVALEIEQRVWRETQALLVVSSELGERALEYGVDAGKIHIVPNGVDLERFVAPTGARASLRRDFEIGTGPVIGFVGSLKTWHGTEVLLRAFAALADRYPDAVLLYVGDGPMREQLESEVQELGMAARVRFTGAVDHAQIPGLLTAMDIAVAPYRPLDDFYFSPIKVYEYMVAGLPVVASRIGQMTELVENGLVVGAEPGDVVSLQTALDTLLRDRNQADGLAKTGREWAAVERSWTANAKRLLELAQPMVAARM